MNVQQKDIPASIAIRSSFSHHSIDSGYKQILKFTSPKFVLGIDELSSEKSHPLFKKYKFLYEFYAKYLASKHEIDIIHILYAEEYFRFSGRLFKDIPVIATFHQPAGILEKEVLSGDPMGRMMKYAHKLNKNRFNKLAAAIVITQAQKEVLQQVMEEDKIHVLPLGFNFKKLFAFKEEHSFNRENIILTVGDWQRDWDYYFDFVKEMQEVKPHWRFLLINRKLKKEKLKLVDQLPNLEYLSDVSDEELYTHYLKSKIQFLPFLSAAGNNSLNEGLTLGCPAVTNFLDVKLKGYSFVYEEELSHEKIEKKIEKIFGLSQEDFDKLSSEATDFASGYDWEETAKQTIEIYKSVL